MILEILDQISHVTRRVVSLSKKSIPQNSFLLSWFERNWSMNGPINKYQRYTRDPEKKSAFWHCNYKARKTK